MLSILSQPANNQLLPIFVPDEGGNTSFVLNSTISSYCSMNYIYQVFRNNNFITTMRNSPNLENGKGVLTPYKIMENFVTSQRWNGFDFINCTQSYSKFDLYFGEESDGTLGCTGSSFSAVYGASASVNVFNGTLQYGEEWNFNDWFVNGVNEGQFLTDAPREQTIGLSESSTLHYISGTIIAGSGSVASQALQIDIQGELNYYVPNYHASATRSILSIGVGPEDIRRYAENGMLYDDAGTLQTTNPLSCGSIYNASITSYPNTGTVSNRSEYIKFNTSCECERFTPYRIMWLNRRGGFDSFTFRLKSTRTISSEKKEYRMFLGQLQGNNTFTYNIGDRGRSVYNSETMEEVTVVSTWLTPEESNWMESLFSGVEAYLITNDDDGIIYNPIIVTSNEIQPRDGKGYTGKKISHTIKFAYAYNKVNQRL